MYCAKFSNTVPETLPENSAEPGDNPAVLEVDAANREADPQPACRECGEPALFPVDEPEYCRACWHKMFAKSRIGLEIYRGREAHTGR